MVMSYERCRFYVAEAHTNTHTYTYKRANPHVSIHQHMHRVDMPSHICVEMIAFYCQSVGLSKLLAAAL